MNGFNKIPEVNKDIGSSSRSKTWIREAPDLKAKVQRVKQMSVSEVSPQPKGPRNSKCYMV